MERLTAGFKWVIETVRDGVVIDTQPAFNLIPKQGLDYMIEASLRGGAAYPNFYVALYEGNYTPVPDDLMATFPGAATELTAYSQAARPLLVMAPAAGGVAENSASKAEFTGTVNGKQAMGGFISSSPTKGGTTGVIVSAVRFPSPKPLDAGTILRVSCGFSIIST